MINKFLNWIKNIFTSKTKDVVDKQHNSREEINEYTDENGKSIKCGTHNRYKKSCPICKEAAGVA
jgi:hypothetical protein